MTDDLAEPTDDAATDDAATDDAATDDAATVAGAAPAARRKHPVRRAVVATAVTTVALVVPTTVWAAQQFSDVPPGHTFATDIGWMADTGVANGYKDGTYKPGEPVTRQAMAAFIHRAYDLENGSDVFGSQTMANGATVTSTTYTNLASVSGELPPITLTVPAGTTAAIEVTVSGNEQCVDSGGDYCRIRVTVNDDPTFTQVFPRLASVPNTVRQPFSFTFAPTGSSGPGAKLVRVQTATTDIDSEQDTSFTLSNVTITAQVHLR